MINIIDCLWYTKSTLWLLLLLFVWGCNQDDNINGNINDPIPTDGVIFNSNLSYGSVSDIDGNVYKTIKIGSHIWMAENLKTTRYRNGDQIPNITDDQVWYNLSSGAYCNYLNELKYAQTFGRLYNYYAAIDSRNIAPAGWHVASDDEWLELLEENNSLDLREVGTTHWTRFSAEYVTNNTGFTALPGGGRLISWKTSNYSLVEQVGFWWCTGNPDYPITHVCWDYTGMERNIENPKRGFSIRCVKD